MRLLIKETNCENIYLVLGCAGFQKLTFPKIKKTSKSACLFLAAAPAVRLHVVYIGKSCAVKLKVQISQKVGGNFTDNSHFSSLFIVKRKFINAEDKSINCIYC